MLNYGTAQNMNNNKNTGSIFRFSNSYRTASIYLNTRRILKIHQTKATVEFVFNS